MALYDKSGRSLPYPSCGSQGAVTVDPLAFNSLVATLISVSLLSLPSEFMCAAVQSAWGQGHQVNLRVTNALVSFLSIAVAFMSLL